MNRMRGYRIIPGLLLAIFLAGVGAAYAKSPIITFTGKIQEIRSATALDIGKADKFITIKLDTELKAEFRLSHEDAVRYGLIDPAGPSQVLTTRRSKGLGWKVRLTCDNDPQGSLTAPVYKVKSLERID